MSFDEEDTQTLVKLGLSSSQARIFLTLCSLGVANAKHIVQKMKMDHAEVYKQLGNLHEKNLVEKILATPTLYRSMPLNEALRILIRQKRELADKENEELEQKAEALSRKRVTPELIWEKWGDSRISIIPGGEYRKLYSTKVVEDTEKEIVGYTQIGREPVALSYYVEAMKKAAARGVHWRNIVELDKPTNSTFRFLEKFKKAVPTWEARFVEPTLYVSFFIYDNKEMNFATEKLTGLADSQTLTTNNAQLIKVVKDYFELRWKSASKEYPKEETDRVSV